MAVPTALDERAEVTTDTDAPASAPRAAMFRLVLLGLLVLALVASIVWIPILLAHRFALAEEVVQQRIGAGQIDVLQHLPDHQTGYRQGRECNRQPQHGRQPPPRGRAADLHAKDCTGA